MSFDEEDSIHTRSNSKDDEKPKTFFGVEVGDSVTYGVVILLTIVFIYQVTGVVAVL